MSEQEQRMKMKELLRKGPAEPRLTPETQWDRLGPVEAFDCGDSAVLKASVELAVSSLTDSELSTQYRAATAKFDPRKLEGWDRISVLYDSHPHRQPVLKEGVLPLLDRLVWMRLCEDSPQ